MIEIGNFELQVRGILASALGVPVEYLPKEARFKNVKKDFCEDDWNRIAEAMKSGLGSAINISDLDRPLSSVNEVLNHLKSMNAKTFGIRLTECERI